MNKKKGNLSRAILLQDQFREDGRTIGRLQLANRYLARQLAQSGIFPDYTPDAGRSADEVAKLTEEWINTAEIVSNQLYGKQSAIYR